MCREPHPLRPFTDLGNSLRGCGVQIMGSTLCMKP